MSQPQISVILATFKDFSACKIVLAAKHLYRGKSQRLFRLPSCPLRKSSISWKNSKTFSPANLSQPQIIDILEIFKDFFACKKFSAATHQNSEKNQRLFRLQNCLRRKSRYPGNIQRLFRLQSCRSRKSSKFWQHSKIFPPAKLPQQQPINILKSFKDFFA